MAHKLFVLYRTLNSCRTLQANGVYSSVLKSMHIKLHSYKNRWIYGSFCLILTVPYICRFGWIEGMLPWQKQSTLVTDKYRGIWKRAFPFLFPACRMLHFLFCRSLVSPPLCSPRRLLALAPPPPLAPQPPRSPVRTSQKK
jgi:hypothetical protein